MENHESNTQNQSNSSLVTHNAGGEVAAPCTFKGRLLLNNHGNARKTYQRIMREYAAGNIDAAMFRNLVYGFSHLLPFFKIELESELLRRIELMEQQLEQVK